MNDYSVINEGNEQKLRKRTPYSDVFGKQAEMMRTWRGAAGRSRCGQRRQEMLGRRQSTAMYGRLGLDRTGLECVLFVCLFAQRAWRNRTDLL